MMLMFEIYYTIDINLLGKEFWCGVCRARESRF